MIGRLNHLRDVFQFILSIDFPGMFAFDWWPGLIMSSDDDNIVAAKDDLQRRCQDIQAKLEQVYVPYTYSIKCLVVVR